MKSKYSVLASLVSLGLLSAFSIAQSTAANLDKPDVYISENDLNRVVITWVEPKKFTDVKNANYSSAKYREHLFEQLEQHIDKLAAGLPEGQTMKFRVTDVDLAGRVEPANFIGISNSFDDIRVMRNIDIPRIKFHYEIVDANGQSLKSDDVSLKDMNYLNGTSLRGQHKSFYHEKKMITRWFKKQILIS